MVLGYPCHPAPDGALQPGLRPEAVGAPLHIDDGRYLWSLVTGRRAGTPGQGFAAQGQTRSHTFPGHVGQGMISDRLVRMVPAEFIEKIDSIPGSFG